jgi:hypothetical protein
MSAPNRKTDSDTATDLAVVDLRRLPRYDKNPLVKPQAVKLGVRRAAATGIDVNDAATTTTVITDEIVDATRFVKVFDAGIKAAYDLSSAASKVYQLVLQATGRGRRNADEITLHPSMVTHAPVKMSEDTYWRGLRELIAKRFIAAHIIPHRYWVNPHFFVKGSTLQIVSRYQLAEERERSEQTTVEAAPAALPPSLFDGEGDD